MNTKTNLHYNISEVEAKNAVLPVIHFQKVKYTLTFLWINISANKSIFQLKSNKKKATSYKNYCLRVHLEIHHVINISYSTLLAIIEIL